MIINTYTPNKITSKYAKLLIAEGGKKTVKNYGCLF